MHIEYEIPLSFSLYAIAVSLEKWDTFRLLLSPGPLFSLSDAAFFYSSPCEKTAIKPL